jgi:V/A-type H+-transporting ATPase subunit B
MSPVAFQKNIYHITNITKATCSLKASGIGNEELAVVHDV